MTSRKKLASKVFDYVVVGGGSSGAVVANRLSKTHKVCLIEAGPDSKHNPFVQIPLAVGFLVSFNRFSNWCFDTTPQERLGGRSIFWPRGKMLGGCSALNGMVYQRGHPYDYDFWAELGNAGWSYQDMLPYFKKLECWEPGLLPDAPEEDALYHGTEGPLRASSIPSPNPLAERFVEAGINAGLPFNRDFNGKTQEGVGLNQWTASRGLRCSTAKSYLSDDIRQRDNLTVLTNTSVRRVLLDGKESTQDLRAVGVELVDSGDEIRATREVIMCGGAVNTPQMLMLSGIGPNEELAKHGIPSVRELPGVGKNLQDHLNLAITCKESSSLSYGLSPSSVHKWLLSPLQLATSGTGMLTSTFAEGGGFAKTNPTKEIPDIQFHFYPSKIKRQMQLSSILGHGFSLQICLLRPKSRGSVTLQSSDPKAAPLINPEYLTEDEDMQTFVDGVKLARRILGTDPLKDHVAEEMLPGADVQSDEDVKEFIRANATTIFHPTGTCKMGPRSDPTAVVDAELRVHGISGLRVVDCSIMPEIVGGNTNVPAVAIGEKASDMILSSAAAVGKEDDVGVAEASFA
eukprot:g2496.t1